MAKWLDGGKVLGYWSTIFIHFYKECNFKANSIYTINLHFTPSLGC